MRVDDTVSPVGIDSTAPTFSWKTDSATLGWSQTTYRILVKNGSETVWDSGKVESATSVGIPYAGAPLQASTEYVWSVTVRNHKGETVTSENAAFETGLLGSDGFGDAKWITYRDKFSSETVYTVDLDFIIDSDGQGFCFGMQSSGTFVLWQVSAKTDGSVLLRPHFKKNGSWTAYPGGPGNVQAIDVTAAVGYGAADVIGKRIYERIEVNGSTVRTYFGTDADRLTLASTYTHSEAIPLGTVGFRHFIAPSIREVTRYGNIKVTDGAGNLLISDDFASGKMEYVGNDDIITEGGMLKIGVSGKK